jgi:rhamnosyltransferase
MRVAVVIRTLNESELVGACLDALRRQRGRFELDLLVVDSGSTDGTLAIARSRGARVIEIAPAEFDYAKALNIGLAEARGDVAVSLSAHAIPVGDDWLEKLVRHFDDPRVAGVAGRQVPWPEAPWQEVHRLRHQFPDVGQRFEDGDGDIVFSNAASAIRLSVWRKQPFTLPAAEDIEWARRVVAAAWSILYEADATVYHSHSESPRAQALRMIDIHRAGEPYGAERTAWRTVREAGGILLRDGRKILELDDRSFGRKLVHLTELARMVWFYVVDYSRAGTTAERRRQTSAG